MAAPAEQQATVLTGAAVALFIATTEMPISKVEVKKQVKKTETTGSTSGAVAAGVFQIFQEFAPGPSGATLSAEGYWRVGTAITPPQLRQGAIYAMNAYVRRPGFNNAADPGSSYIFNAIVDDNTVTLDPNSGAIIWKLSATVTGPIIDPQ